MTYVTDETRDAYRRKLRSKLDAWGEELNRLKVSAGNAGAAEPFRREEQLQRLQESLDVLYARMEALQWAGDETWEKIRDRTVSTSHDIEAALVRVRSEFSA